MLSFYLSIIPEGSHLPQTYPRTMLYCLYHLLCDDFIDGIILADNDVLRRNYNCKGNYDYNSLLHEIISPIFLAPSGRFSVQNFGSVLDGADIRRSLRPKIAIDQPELCSIGFAAKKMPSSTKLKFQSDRQRRGTLAVDDIDVKELILQLVDFLKTTPVKPRSNVEKAD